ncbi:MAG: hypothetical protein WC179_08725 [Candidatus Cloacimonadaceae bacterium]|jgi:hypothetical protein
MSFMIFIYELIIAILVFVFINAISNQTIAAIVAAVVLLFMLNRSLDDPYK